MAVSMHWGAFFWRVLVMRDLLLGVYTTDLDFWKLPNERRGPALQRGKSPGWMSQLRKKKVKR